ncbi:MAG TPA: hypothetical protein VF398_07840, partial [bacterium]
MDRNVWRTRFIFGAAVGVVFLAALFFARPIYLPDAFLISQLESRISAASGFDLSIQSGRMNLRHAIILQHVTLCDSTADFNITADEVTLRYRLLPLLKKSALFSEIRILNPQIHFVTRTDSAMGSSPDKSSAGGETPQKPSSRRPSELPYEIQVAHLSLINATFRWEKCSPSDTLRLLIPGMDLHAQDVHLNRQAALLAEWRVEQRGTINLENVGATKAHALKASSQMRFEVSTTADSSRVVGQLDFRPQIEGRSSSGEMHSLNVPEIYLDFDARLTHWRDLTVDSLNLSLENLLELQASATVANLFKAPRLNVRLPQASVFLDSAWDFFHELTRQFGRDSGFDDWKLAGRLQLQDGSLQWAPAAHPPDLQASLHFEIGEASIECKSLDLMAGDLRAESDARIRLSPQDSLQLQWNVDLTAGLVAKSMGRDSLLKLNSLDLGMSADVGSGWSHPRFQLEWQAQGPYDTRLEGNFTARADTLVSANPLLSPNFIIEGGASVDGLPLEMLFPSGPRGDVSVALDIKAQTPDNVNLKLGIFGWDVWFALGDKVVLFPPSLLKLDATCSLDPDFRRFYLRRGKVECNPYFASNFADASTDFSLWEIRQSDFDLNLTEIHSVLQPALPARFAQAQIGGQLQLKASMWGSFDDGKFTLLPECTLSSSEMALAMPDLGLSADSVFFIAGLEGDWKDLAVSGEIQAGTLALPQLRESPYRQIALDFGGKLREFERLDSLVCRLRSDELHLQIESRGWLGWAPPWPRGELANQVHFVAADTIFPLADVASSGNLNADIQLTFESDSSFGVTGRVSADSLFVDHRRGWRIQNAYFDLPFHQEAKFADHGIEIPSASADALSLPDPVQFAGLAHQSPSALNQGEFRADLLQIEPYVLEDIHGIIFLGQGFLHIPQMRARAYEGDLSGACNLYISALMPDSIRY